MRARAFQLRSREQEKGCWVVLSQTKGTSDSSSLGQVLGRDLLGDTKDKKLQKAAREAQLLCGLQGRAPIMTFGGDIRKEEVSQAQCGPCQ